MLSFTITGLYEESRSSKSFKVTRLFSRNFTAVYQGAGELHIYLLNALPYSGIIYIVQ